MKFCPECGSIFKEGITTCEICGYGKSDEEKEKIRNKNINNNHGFIEPGYDIMNNKNIVPMLGIIPLEELKRRKLDYGNINSISYTSSGGMEGRYYSEVLNFYNKELIVDDKTFHNSVNVRNIYKVLDKDIEDVKKIIIDNNMFAWSEVPVNRMFLAMDMPSNNMNIYTDNYNFTISYNIFMDDEENKIFNDLRSLVRSFIKKENLISNETINNSNLGMIGNDKLKDSKQKYCLECGGVIEKDKKFCPNCGYKNGE